MPIKRLTNQQAQFPEIGQLRKGAPKTSNRPGKDLTYFRFTSDIPEVVKAFADAYDGEPRLVNVFLPFPTTDENMEAWQEEYTASSLIHRCDGDTMVLWQDDDGAYHTGAKRCPYAEGRERTKQRPGCRPVGRVKVIIPELGRLAFVTVLTTSIHDIRNLDAQLRALESLRGNLRGIPLQLRRRPKKIPTPSGPNGGRARREKWLLSIEAAPQWVALQLAAAEAEARPQIAAPRDDDIVEVNAKTGEIVSPGQVEKASTRTGYVDSTQPPIWDSDTSDENQAEEGEFEPPPDALLMPFPRGDFTGRTIGEVLESNPEYVEKAAREAKSEEIRKAAQEALEWHEAQLPPF